MVIDLEAKNFVVVLMAVEEAEAKPSEEALTHIDIVASVGEEGVDIGELASAENIEEVVEVVALAFAAFVEEEEEGDVGMKVAFADMMEALDETSAFVKVEDQNEPLERDIAEEVKLHHQLVQHIIRLCIEFHLFLYLQQILLHALQILNRKTGQLFD